MNIQQIQEEINKLNDSDIELINDKYHSFKELYNFRKVYNAVLFNEWARDWYIRNEQIKNGGMIPSNVIFPKYDVHKSWKHNNGELCFGGGWFVVVAMLPTGQISNHYKAEDWDLFKIPEYEKAKRPFDNHTSDDVLNRLISL